MKRGLPFLALLAFCLLSQLVIGQEQAPLQADIQLRVESNNRRLVRFSAGLEGGEATVRGSVQNLPGDETALVSLHFDFKTDADIALDEIISQIVVSTSDRSGNEFSKATIDPNTVSLNPNRAPLFYSTTLYRPPQDGRKLYSVRIQVFGNYE